MRCSSTFYDMSIFRSVWEILFRILSGLFLYSIFIEANKLLKYIGSKKKFKEFIWPNGIEKSAIALSNVGLRNNYISFSLR